MNLWQRKNLAVSCLLGLALTVSAQAQRYSVWTPIGTPDITQPITGDTIPTEFTVTLRCRPVGDNDYDNLTCSVVSDGATLTWTAKDGSGNDVGEFTDNTGPEATWIAPEAEGTVTIYATADDNPNYLADDPPQPHSHTVNIEKIFRFVAWADNRPSQESTNQSRTRSRWVLQQMNNILCSGRNYYWPAFHVVPGDYDGTQETIDDLKDYLPSSFRAWERAPGNHDDVDMAGLFNHTVDYQNARFIYLNEYICPLGNPPVGCDNHEGRVCEHIRSWLEGQLTDAPPFVQFVFVVGHEPAFPEHRHVGSSLDKYPTERNAFWSLLNSSDDPPVYAYLCGHTHVYGVSSDAPGPTLQIDLGNAGNYSPLPSGELEQTFVFFEVRDTGITRHTYRGTYGNTFGEYYGD